MNICRFCLPHNTTFFDVNFSNVQRRSKLPNVTTHGPTPIMISVWLDKTKLSLIQKHACKIKIVKI